MSEYAIRSDVLGTTLQVESDDSEFHEAVRARGIVLESMAIEETFDLLIKNYSDYEQDLLSNALDNMLHAPQSWVSSSELIQGVNRRLLNLLAACKIMLDHLPQRVKAITGKSAASAGIDTIRHAQYDAFLGYRVMEALRNHIQHRGIPIRRLRHNMETVNETTEDVHKRSTLVPLLDVEQLKADNKVKRSIVEELLARGAFVDIRPLVREYVQGLGAVQITTRDTIRNDLDRSVKVIKSIRDRWVAAGGEDESGIFVMRSKGSRVVTRISVGTEIIDRHRSLYERNKWLNRFIRHYVSNEAPRLGANDKAPGKTA